MKKGLNPPKAIRSAVTRLEGRATSGRRRRSQATSAGGAARVRLAARARRRSRSLHGLAFI